MMKSQNELVEALKAEGMVIDMFTLTSEGPYTETDADWNYKDVLHLFRVHSRMRPVLGIIEHDKEIFINLQKVLGLSLPLSIVSYHPATEPGTSFMSWLFYTLVISTRYAQPAANTCRIETTYAVGAPKLLVWTLPIVRWLIKRNHAVLAADDIPMRMRRAELRKRGYNFRRIGDRYSFLETMDLSRSNVVPPTEAAPFGAVKIDLGKNLPPDGQLLLGDDGHLGLRLIRQSDRILVFPRLCSHEGASLDHEVCKDNRISCPWHGRVVAPLAVLDAVRPESEEREVGPYLLRREKTVLWVGPRADKAGDRA